MTLLVVVIVVGLLFDFTNGFHDAANYVATWVGTRALSPRAAVLVSAGANLAGAFFLMVIIYRVFFRAAPGVAHRGFRLGQLVTGTWVAFTHGANDAQKTMGVIALALFAHGSIDSFYVPTWVKVAAGLSIAAGTYVGGWRIMRTLGQRVFQMEPASGFAAQTSSGIVIFLATHLGYPLSTTHVVSGAVMGAGATKRLSAVRWGVAGNIAVAWLLTIPMAALVAAVLYWPVQGLF
jgi:PiT family inorganic phosphate transporter